MKRSFPINLAGRVFYIDEDAYTLLDNYLNNLTITFGAEEDREVINDIETRISDILSDARQGNCDRLPVTLADVTGVIDIIGSVEQVLGNDDEATSDTHESGNGSPVPPPYVAPQTCRRKLYRNMSDVSIGGVVSGLCAYMNWSVTPMRIILLVLALFFFPVLFLVYLVAWAIIPPARTAEQQLEMTGCEVNLNSIGHTVKTAYAEPDSTKNHGTVSSLIRLIGKIGLVIIGLIAVVLFIPAVVCVLLAAVALLSPETSGLYDHLAVVSILPEPIYPLVACGALLCWSIAALVLCLLIIYFAFTTLTKSTTGPSRSVLITLTVMVIIFATLGILLGLFL